ncbi:hypothetical protein DSM21852_30150 [Methylocystis bryophila]|nr:hypothetical protein DSM21852_30150 [Methylocystis bryophila]
MASELIDGWIEEKRVSRHQDAIEPTRLVEKPHGFVRRLCHGFFDKNMFAVSKRGRRELVMRWRRRCYDEGADVRQSGLEVLKRLRVRKAGDDAV